MQSHAAGAAGGWGSPAAGRHRKLATTHGAFSARARLPAWASGLRVLHASSIATPAALLARRAWAEPQPTLASTQAVGKHLCRSPRASPSARCGMSPAPSRRYGWRMISSCCHQDTLKPGCSNRVFFSFIVLFPCACVRLAARSCQESRVLILVRWFTQRFLVCFVFTRIQDDMERERTFVLCLK